MGSTVAYTIQNQNYAKILTSGKLGAADRIILKILLLGRNILGASDIIWWRALK
jgi:hypothetical protein